MTQNLYYHCVSRRILGDMVTPVSTYMKLRDDYPQSALMESSDYHGGENARSFIALHPIASIAVEHGVAVAKYPDGKTVEKQLSKAYTTDYAINEFLHAFHIEGEGSEYCGLYGYTSFNAVRYFEQIDVKDETQEKNDAPDLLYILF